MSIWPIKINFRPNPDKELSKDIKLNSKSTVLSLLLKACELFNIKETHAYSLYHKKVKLSLLDSLEDCQLVQGSTVTLNHSQKSRDKKEVIFNYKIHRESGLLKLVGHYQSTENFISCLQAIPSDSETFNALKHPAKVPMVHILSAKLSSTDLMLLREFDLESLGLRGNYLVNISFESLADSFKSFNEFLDSLDIKHSDHSCNSSSQMIIEPKITLPSSRNSVEEYTNNLNDINNIDYRIYRPSITNTPTPDLPDSFFELTKEELLSFQKALQNVSKTLNERPFISKKKNLSLYTNHKKEYIAIKLVFPDQMNVHVNLSSDCTVGTIIEFIKNRIFESFEGNIELWTGTPAKLLTNIKSTLYDAGIQGPTRINVSCKKFNYCKNLVFNDD